MKVCAYALWKNGYTIFVTLSPANGDLIAAEVDVLDAEAYKLFKAHARAIEHPDHHLVSAIINGVDNAGDFLFGEHDW
jgi:hypothetical protein